MTIHVRIREIRRDSSLTMKEFAARIGVSPSYISMIESPEKHPSRDLQPSEKVLKNVEREFAVNPGWLRGGEGQKYLPTVALLERIRSLRKDQQEALEKFLETVT